MPKEDPSPMRFAGVGMELTGAVLGMALIGYGIDRWRGSEPWGVVIGSTLGLVGGLYNIVRTVTRDDR
jgi:F0F1-type ATP synthase assembly protein I